MTAAILDEAIDAHQEEPRLLGRCIRALRLSMAMGGDEVARAISSAFARGHGAPELGGEALCAFARQAPVRRYPPGATIVKEGEDDDTAFVIIAGEVSVRRGGVGHVGSLGPGETFGEIAAISGVRRTATCQAETEVDALVMPRKTLSELARFLPPIAVMLKERMRERMLPQLMPAHTAFGELRAPEQKALYTRFIPITVPKGTRVLREEVEGPGLCVIVSGAAEVWRSDINEQKVHLATLRPGDVFGEISLVFGGATTANVEAASDLTVFALRPADFEQFMKTFPHAAERIINLAEDRSGRQYVERRALKIEGLSNAPIALSPEERASFTAGYVANTCPQCGFDSADVVCMSCGAVI